MNTFGWAIRLATKVFEFCTSKEQREKRRKRSLEEKVDDVTNAVKDGDESAVNSRLRDHTMKLLALGLTITFLCGCVKTRVEYIPEAQKAERIVRDGVKGWFVPDGVMAVLMEKAERYDAMQEKKLLEENNE